MIILRVILEKSCGLDNIKIHLREMWYEVVHWIQVAQTGICEQSHEPSGLEFLDWLTDY
jgi:hypothetical protein